MLEHPDHLLIHPPARQEPVPLEIGWIVPVFSDDHDAIDRKVRPPKLDRLTDGLVDGDVLRLGDFLAQEACFKLVDVDRDDVHSRRRVCALPPVTVHQLGDDPVRM